MILQEKQQGEKYYTIVDINKYGEIPPMDTSLPWPTLELEIPMTTPPKGRPNTSSQLSTQLTQKRPLSPESSQFTIVRGRKSKKTKKKLSAESSIGDNHNSSDDENISDLAYMHKIITGKKTLTKKDFVKKQ